MIILPRGKRECGGCTLACGQPPLCPMARFDVRISQVKEGFAVANGDEVRRASALCLSVFFDELAQWGVREVVVSPGSRSTGLALCAYELARREPGRLTVYVDVDERSAGFFALGLAKASGHPAALVCTSGTALANYYPAVLEAETSRVPIIVLSGDRPPHLQGLGAPQTCDQEKAYGDHVRRFAQMPLPERSPRAVAFFRQMARELALAALPGGVLSEERAGVQVASRGCDRMAGPVHANFPLDEPLLPDFSALGVFNAGRSELSGSAPVVAATGALSDADAKRIAGALSSGRALVLAGEGTCEIADEAREVAAWAQRFRLPVLADPLSGLRTVSADVVIDNYDNVFGRDDCPAPDVVVRFGRYPVSKRTTRALDARRPLGIVVDAGQTRDFNYDTDLFAEMAPLAFMRALSAAGDFRPSANQEDFLRSWVRENEEERKRIGRVDDPSTWEEACGQGGTAPEGAYVRAIFDRTPEGSCVFSANSMAIRAIDTFCVKRDKRVAVLCNRGLNGIDGTVSTALGASRHFAQTTFLTGDFTLQHDIGALALQRELLQVAAGAGTRAPSVVVVLLNNNGGGVFEMLPQASDEPYFARLFSAPQDIRFDAAAQAFNVPYRKVATPTEFSQVYGEFLGTPGITLIEVALPLGNLKSRYRFYQ